MGGGGNDDLEVRTFGEEGYLQNVQKGEGAQKSMDFKRTYFLNVSQEGLTLRKFNHKPRTAWVIPGRTNT